MICDKGTLILMNENITAHTNSNHSKFFCDVDLMIFLMSLTSLRDKSPGHLGVEATVDA